MELAQALTLAEKLRHFPKEQDEFICSRIERGMSNSQIKREFFAEYKMKLDGNNIKSRRKRLGVPLPSTPVIEEAAKEALSGFVEAVNELPGDQPTEDQEHKWRLGPQLTQEEDALIIEYLDKKCTIPFIIERFFQKFGRRINSATVRLRKDRMRAEQFKHPKTRKAKVLSIRRLEKRLVAKQSTAIPGLPPELFVDPKTDMRKWLHSLRDEAIVIMRKFNLQTITINDDGKMGRCEVLRVEKIEIE